MSRILHKSFRYVPAHKSDIKATFRRIEREQKAKAEQEAANALEAQAKVQKLKRTA